MKDNLPQIPRIETWFPKSIYIVDNVCVNLLKNLKAQIQNNDIQTKRSQTLNVDSTHLVNNLLHKTEVFCDLKNSIEYHARLFLEYMGYNSEYVSKCDVVNMWYNISNKNDFLFPHTHPGSILAGAYYVESIEENNIIFYDDMTSSYEPPTNITNLSMTTCNYPCVPGRLLLFRSNLLHGTPKQINEGQKIVISFNINKF